MVPASTFPPVASAVPRRSEYKRTAFAEEAADQFSRIRFQDRLTGWWPQRGGARTDRIDSNDDQPGAESGSNALRVNRLNGGIVTVAPMSRSVQRAVAARRRADVTVKAVIRGTTHVDRVVAALAVDDDADGIADRHTIDTTVDHTLSDRFMATPYRSSLYSEVAPCACVEISSTSRFQ